MELYVEACDHLPVHIQLREQIRFLILNGELAPGSRLPPARQLAGFLHINRNTVQRAYRELAQEGLVECRQGRGCVVTAHMQPLVPRASAELLEQVDNLLTQAQTIGLQPSEVAALLLARARHRMHRKPPARLVFVECETPIAEAAARVLQERLGIPVQPLVLRELRARPGGLEAALRDVSVVATTFFHIQELRQALARIRKEVVALSIKPQLENLIQIAAIPRGTRVALVCTSQGSAQELRHSLEISGITGLEIVLVGVDEPQCLQTILPSCPVIVVSDFVADVVRPLVQPGQQLIVLDYKTLDEAAIDFLHAILTDSQLPASRAVTARST
ncbi:MAG: GntR family transcriptional regulator [Anaerolineae bacterium]